ncbi:alpha beta-hydrolase [Russula ochroleuca]|uniref:Alpha beta-hydrolase n=1 Tax=Russula ochroleuca TaxID=152965 RepID=A0A9P5JXK1_9AGAM|nr:alpha beta-hydrolase [Russula ochroleuca]
MLYPFLIQMDIAFCVSHRTAVEVLEAVNVLIGEHPSATVATVGHSLGAAIALLDGVYLRLQLDPSIGVRVIGYGLPRVGNQDFANYVDYILPKDVAWVSGTTIVGARSTSKRPENGAGQDNPDPRCIVGTVSNIYDATFSDHRGPYNGITLTCD